MHGGQVARLPDVTCVPPGRAKALAFLAQPLFDWRTPGYVVQRAALAAPCKVEVAVSKPRPGFGYLWPSVSFNGPFHLSATPRPVESNSPPGGRPHAARCAIAVLSQHHSYPNTICARKPMNHPISRNGTSTGQSNPAPRPKAPDTQVGAVSSSACSLWTAATEITITPRI